MAGNPQFTGSLAVAGETGTLVDEMRGTYAAGGVAGKTGTLHDASNVVGYCQASDGHTLAFAFLMNGITPTTPTHPGSDAGGGRQVRRLSLAGRWMIDPRWAWTAKAARRWVGRLSWRLGSSGGGRAANFMAGKVWLGSSGCPGGRRPADAVAASTPDLSSQAFLVRDPQHPAMRVLPISHREMGRCEIRSAPLSGVAPPEVTRSRGSTPPLPPSQP